MMNITFSWALCMPITLHVKKFRHNYRYSPDCISKSWEHTNTKKALLTTRLQSRGMTRNPDGKRGTSSETATSTGAKTSWAHAPTAFSSTPLHNCIPHPHMWPHVVCQLRSLWSNLGYKEEEDDVLALCFPQMETSQWHTQASLHFHFRKKLGQIIPE
jgi:hypothetical protein